MHNKRLFHHLKFLLFLIIFPFWSIHNFYPPGDYNRVLECPHDMIYSLPTKLQLPLSGSNTLSKIRNNFRINTTSNDSKKFTKAFCPHGTVCCARIDLFDDRGGTISSNNSKVSSYTGLLEPGKSFQHCMIRLSSAMKPPASEKNRFGTFFLKATGGKLKHAKLVQAKWQICRYGS